MAEGVATTIHRRAWTKDVRFICKSMCDKICRDLFGPGLEERVWNRLNGTEVPREDVPLAERERALRRLGTACSDERWLKLSEPPPAAFDVQVIELDPYDLFEEDYWTCDEDESFAFVGDLADQHDEPPLKRSKR